MELWYKLVEFFCTFLRFFFVFIYLFWLVKSQPQDLPDTYEEGFGWMRVVMMMTLHVLT